MNIQKAFGIVAIAGLAFAAMGALIGAALGQFAPDYFRAVLRIERSQEFDPLQIGIGLGVTQGMVTGVVVAIIVIGILAWRDTRIERRDRD